MEYLIILNINLNSNKTKNKKFQMVLEDLHHHHEMTNPMMAQLVDSSFKFLFYDFRLVNVFVEFTHANNS